MTKAFWRACAALVAALLFVGTLSSATAANLLQIDDNPEGGGNRHSIQSAQNVCFPDNKVDGPGTISGAWGSATWGGDDRSLDLTVNDGWTVEICVKAGPDVHVFTANAGTPDPTYSRGISHVAFRNVESTGGATPSTATPDASNNNQGNQGQSKVTICHRTSSDTNPYVKITIAEAGWINGHSNHEGDILLTTGDEVCPTTAPAAAAGAANSDSNINLVTIVRFYLNGEDVTERVLSGELNFNLAALNAVMEDRLATAVVSIEDPELEIRLQGSETGGNLFLTAQPDVTLLMNGVDVTDDLAVAGAAEEAILNSPAITQSGALQSPVPADTGNGGLSAEGTTTTVVLGALAMTMAAMVAIRYRTGGIR